MSAIFSSVVKWSQMNREVKYLKAYDALRSEILGGKYLSRRAFPSIVATCKRFGISRLTAFKVFDKLKEDGLISTRQGSGTFVAKDGQSRLIGLVIPGVSYASEFFQPIVASLIRLAHDNDYTILMEGVWSLNSSDNSHEALEVAARLVKRRVAGVIYQPLEYSENSEAVNRRVLSAFTRAGIPVVLLDGDIVPYPARSEYDLVSIDNIAAGETIAAHLMERGAKNIYFLMRENWVQNVMNRVKGVRNVVQSTGVKWTGSNVVMADPTDEVKIAKIMRRRNRPDAFVCENDVLAAGLKLSLERLGYAIAKDVMVVGFDDVRIARLAMPGITTIRQPCEALAKTAFERLLKRMSDCSSDPVQIVCPFKLIERGSTDRRTIYGKEKAQHQNQGG